jgi:hypothetical protein
MDSVVLLLPFMLLALLALPALAGVFGTGTQLCVILVVLGAVANSYAAKWHAEYVCGRGACEATPLPDRGFDLIDDHSSDDRIVAVVDALPVLVFCALIVTLYCRTSATRNTVLLGFALALLARAVIVQATGLPPAKQGNGSLPMAETAMAKLLDPERNGDGVHNSLHDLMFSGHECIFVSSVLWLLYLHGFLSGPMRFAWYAVAALAAVAQGAGLVAIRVHYTVDVLVGALVAVLIFTIGRQRLEKSQTLTRAS